MHGERFNFDVGASDDPKDSLECMLLRGFGARIHTPTSSCVRSGSWSRRSTHSTALRSLQSNRRHRESHWRQRCQHATIMSDKASQSIAADESPISSSLVIDCEAADDTVWTRVSVTGGMNDAADTAGTTTASYLDLSNPSVPLPLDESNSPVSATVCVLDEFVSYDEAATLDRQLTERRHADSKWEGFDGPRRRVQSYSFATLDDMHESEANLSSSSINSSNSSNPQSQEIPTTTQATPLPPPMLVELQRRLWQRTGLKASHVKIEEYAPISIQRNSSNGSNGLVYDPTILSAFASRHPLQESCPCQANEDRHDTASAKESDADASPVLETTACSCFVAEIPFALYENEVEDGAAADECVTTINSSIAAESAATRATAAAATSTAAAPAPAPAMTMDLIQNWNQPASRNAMCWNLASTNHSTHVRLRSQTAVVKQGPLLWDWRSSRILVTAAAAVGGSTAEAAAAVPASTLAASTVDPAPTDQMTVRMIQFYNLAVDNGNNNADDEKTAAVHSSNDDKDDAFGYVPTREDAMERQRRRQQSAPPLLSDLLTIVVTTSPIKSNPSTEVIERAMGTFALCGPEFAFDCRKVIVCDGFRTLEDEGETVSTEPNEPNSTTAKSNQNKISRRHNNHKQAMRNGIVNSEQAENYRQYKQRLRQLCLDAESSFEPRSVFANAQVVELDERHGYGFALRHVLRNCIDTPFVCVVQHDRTFMRPTPMLATVQTMWYHTNVKYVGFSMRSNLMYRDIFLGKYGGGLHQQTQQHWNDMVLYLPELCLPAAEFGPDSQSTLGMEVNTDKLRQNIASLAETYRGSAQAGVARVAAPKSAAGASDSLTDTEALAQCQLSLVPTLYWYDNVHICETSHYRDFVFEPSYKMVTRGGFIEDKLSPVLKRTVERLGLKDGHSRFGCYLLDDHSGYFFTGHIDGGSFISEEERQALLASQKAQKPADG